MNTLKHIGLFVVGYVVAFFLNFSFSFQDDHLTFSMAFLLYFGMGIWSGRKKRKVQLLLVAGIVVHFTLLTIFIKHLLMVDLLVGAALVSFVPGVMVRQLFHRRKAIALLTGTTIVMATLPALYVGINHFAYARASITVSDQQFCEVTLVDVNNTPVFDGALKGKITIIETWNIFCGYCKTQFPYMEELQQMYPQVQVLAVNNGIADNHDEFVDFVQSTNSNLLYLYDRDTAIVRYLQLKAAPQTIVIDQEGRVQWVMKGFGAVMQRTFMPRITTLIDQLLQEETSLQAQSVSLE